MTSSPASLPIWQYSQIEKFVKKKNLRKGRARKDGLFGLIFGWWILGFFGSCLRPLYLA